jgi:hypothetical protein
MTIVSIPAWTPITVEVSHFQVNNKFTAISKELQEIVNKTWVSAMDILTKLSWTDGVPHSANYFANVTTEPDYKYLESTWNTFWVLEKDTKLVFEEEQVI